MVFKIIEVRTRWIADDGRDSSHAQMFDHSSEEVAAFLTHTMGWVKINFFGQTYEVSFDPRSLREGAENRLISWIREMGNQREPWLIKVHIFTGQGWITETSSAVAPLLETLERFSQFGKPPRVPATIDTQQRDLETVDAFRAPDIRNLVNAWKAAGPKGLSMAHPTVNAVAENKVSTRRAVKILQKDERGRICFGQLYRPSGTTLWSDSLRGEFPGASVVEVVPDRALGSNVDQLAREMMASAQPRVEFCSGPLLSSHGIVAEVVWHRLSIPLGKRHGPKAVLVVTNREPAGQNETIDNTVVR